MEGSFVVELCEHLTVGVTGLLFNFVEFVHPVSQRGVVTVSVCDTVILENPPYLFVPAKQKNLGRNWKTAQIVYSNSS